jgi:hypothetical protein
MNLVYDRVKRLYLREKFMKMTKQILIIFLITLALCLTAKAQAKKPALPNNLARYVDEYPVELMKVRTFKTRLKTLLGKKYSTFDEYITVQAPIKQVGDFLLASGCLPHSCTISEAAFAVDLKNKRIHAVIYEQNMPAKYYNEDKAQTPEVLINWVNELKQMK